MAGWSSRGRTSMPAMVAMVVLVLMTLMGLTKADFATLLLGWRQFTIDNIFAFNGIPPCPSSNPNTVAFYPSSSNPLAGTVTIVGEFDAASIGVCTGSPYAVAPGTTITYNIYGDFVIFQIDGRVNTASKFVFQQGKLSAVLVQQNFYVSELTDIGHAP